MRRAQKGEENLTNKNCTMNINQHPARIEQLSKILAMLHLCERFITGDRQLLARQQLQQLRGTAAETESRIELRTKVRERLLKYYARKVFALASEAYNAVAPV